MKKSTKESIYGLIILLLIICIIVLLFVNPLLIVVPVGLVIVGFFSFGIGLLIYSLFRKDNESYELNIWQVIFLSCIGLLILLILGNLTSGGIDY
mgnify:CR=1 FL=1